MFDRATARARLHLGAVALIAAAAYVVTLHALPLSALLVDDPYDLHYVVQADLVKVDSGCLVDILDARFHPTLSRWRLKDDRVLDSHRSARCGASSTFRYPSDAPKNAAVIDDSGDCLEVGTS